MAATPKPDTLRRVVVLSVGLASLLVVLNVTMLLLGVDEGHLAIRLNSVLVAAFAVCGLFAAFIAISHRYRSVVGSRVQPGEGKLNADFQLLAEAITHIAWSAAADGTIEHFNQRWFDYAGAPSFSRGSWLQRVHPDDQQAALSAWQFSLKSGRPFSIEFRLRNVAGSFRWQLARALPLRDENGAILRWLGTFTDVDDQRRAQEAITRLAAIVESSEDAIFSEDLDGTIRSWNAGAEKIYGYTSGEIIGRHVSVLCPPDRVSEAEAVLVSIRDGRSVEHLETIRIRKDGAPVEVSLAISPVRDAAGAITGASIIARDVTERNRAADALRKTEKMAATGRLAGTIAHEINNPLDALTHLLYLLDKNASLDDQARQYARVAMDEVNRIGHIARHALGFYREASEPVQVNVSEVIEEVVELYRAGAQNKNVQLETQPETSTTIAAFPREMRQVFSNLIVNAVDAVQRGGRVTIRVKHGRDWRSHALGIRVLVSDDGPGIPAELRARIFEPFFTTKGERGTGVGLWVSEGVLQKQGGSIRLKSSTGADHGTTFAVFLPYA
jgi:PAS domain S-box-containing protein